MAPTRNLIDNADENSAITQSLMARNSSFFPATHASALAVFFSIVSAATRRDVSR
jgi:hypothetical protein